MDDISVNLVLTVPDINQILSALAKQPYGEVHLLVGKVKSQGDAVMTAVLQRAHASNGSGAVSDAVIVANDTAAAE